MSKNAENMGLSKFAIKAMEKLESKKQRKTVKLYVESIDEEITIQNVTETELYESLDIEDKADKTGLADKHIIYKSVVEPNLKEVAKELKEQGRITEYIEVVDMFDLVERKAIADEIYKLSGMSTADGKKVKLVLTDALKN